MKKDRLLKIIKFLNIAFFAIFSVTLVVVISKLIDKRESETIDTATIGILEDCDETQLITIVHGEFVCNSEEVKFIGVNVRELAYVDAQILPSNEFDDLEYEVREHVIAASMMGAKVIRLYAPHKNYDTQSAIERVERVMDVAQEIDPGMKFMITLTDFVKSNQHIRGDNGEIDPNKDYYPDQFLGREWFEGGYNDYYRPFVLEFTEAFKDDPRIFAWQLVNEPQIPEPVSDKVAVMVDFIYDIAGAMKDEVGVSQLITPGFKHVNHSVSENLTTEQIPDYLDMVYNGIGTGLLRDVPTPSPVDFPSFNLYNGDLFGRTDINAEINWYNEHEKIYTVTEISIDPEYRSDRAEEIFDVVKALPEAGGFMQWGFMPGNTRLGVDSRFGMDYVHFTDWVDRGEAAPGFEHWGDMYNLYSCLADFFAAGSEYPIEECDPDIFSIGTSIPNLLKPFENTHLTVPENGELEFIWESVTSSFGDNNFILVIFSGKDTNDDSGIQIYTGLNDTSFNVPAEKFDETYKYGYQVYYSDGGQRVIHSPIYNFTITKTEPVDTTPTVSPTTDPTVSPTPSVTPTPEILSCGPIDVNDDEFIDIIDFANFAKKWKKSCELDSEEYRPCGPIDIDSTAFIDIIDFAQFVRKWKLECTAVPGDSTGTPTPSPTVEITVTPTSEASVTPTEEVTPTP
jgi:hypothetical protein